MPRGRSFSVKMEASEDEHDVTIGTSTMTQVVSNGLFRRIKDGVLTMKLQVISLFGTIALACQIAIPSYSYAQTEAKRLGHKSHQYTPYEQLVYENASHIPSELQQP